MRASGLLGLLLCVPLVAGASVPAIDLETGSLGGRAFHTYTLDEATDLLGRPSTVTSPLEIDGRRFGARLKYHALGLSLSFAHPGDDAARHCGSMDVYLTRQWDDKAAVWYSAFTGEIHPAVTCEWKADRVLDVFGTARASDLFDQEEYDECVELEAALVASGVRDGSGRPMSSTVTAVLLRTDTHNVRFEYEYNTRFIDRLSIFVPMSHKDQ